MNVQIFGIKRSNETRAAERFFKERRVAIQMVDLHQRPMAPAEVRRFADRFGLGALLDTEGKSYVDAGLKYLLMSNADILARIGREPQLLRLPLVPRRRNVEGNGRGFGPVSAIAGARRTYIS